METGWKVDLSGGQAWGQEDQIGDGCTASAFQQVCSGLTYGTRVRAKDTRGKVHNWATEKSKERRATEELTDLLSHLWLSTL